VRKYLVALEPELREFVYYLSEEFSMEGIELTVLSE